MSHSWCRDIPRDEAVRASEDGRDGPLPTLEEAISRAGQFASPEAPNVQKCPERESVTKRMPPEPGGGGNVTGLRTDRVTLQITGAPGWTVQVHGCDVESVRVVEETHFDDLAQVAMQRDSAIRERESLREQLESVACRAATAENRVAELERLSRQRAATTLARVDELEHRGRESYSRGWNAAITREREAENASKQQQAAAETALEAAPATSGNSSEILTSSPAASGAAGTEPDAWGVRRKGGVDAVVHRLFRSSAEQSAKQFGGTVVALYAAPVAESATTPQTPRGWLTAEERAAMTLAAQQAPESDFVTTVEGKWINKTLTALLARDTPPEVVRPEFVETRDCHDGMNGARIRDRDSLWLAALAAAGVTVKEVG